MPLQFSSCKGKRRRMRVFYSLMALPLLAIMLISGALTLLPKGSAHAALADTPAPLRGTMPTVLTHSKLVGPAASNQTISLSIGLRMRNAALLKQYAEDVSRPKSVNFHRYLTLAQIIGAFSPSIATQNAVLQYLRSSGFTITHTYTHRMLISFTGTVAVAERAFHVTINNYTAPSGEAFYSNTSDPLLPASLLGQVQIISGLNNAVRWHHGPLSARKVPPRQAKPASNTVICPGPGAGYYTPGQIASAYDLNGLYNQNLFGQGQTMALFELDTFQMSDITKYELCFGHSGTPIDTIVAHGPVPTDAGVGEVELDAELALSTAPSLGRLKIYEASNDATGYNDEWAQIIQDGSPVVSTSWGACETDLGFAQASFENLNFFSFAALQGQSIFAASGDTGSEDCFRTGDPTSLVVDDPAAQPFVTGVGGTTLTVDSNDGDWVSEDTWNNQRTFSNNPVGGASGGGFSAFWPRPWWQAGTGVTAGTPDNRQVPDVSLNADPFTGYPIYCSSTAAGCTTPGFYIFGGTSAAAPMWAAFMALENEQEVQGEGFNIGFANPLLYFIASNSGRYAADFHDITTFNNDFNHVNGGIYAATVGYDKATGLGSYQANNLANGMFDFTSSRQVPAATTWYFAEGSVGGGFQEYITVENPSLDTTATVTIKYLVQSHPSVTVTHTVHFSSRSQINVNNDLHVGPNGSHLSVGAIVTSTVPIVAERPMYFNALGVASGTDVMGESAPQTAYYFSEADTTALSTANYHTFLSMLNPDPTLTETVTITYYTGNCGGTGQALCPTELVTLGPLERRTALPTDVGLHRKLAIKVASTHPVVVERPLYFKDTISNVGVTTGAATELGATSPATDWLFAEGFTGSGFHEYYELANFGAVDATATVYLEYTNGFTKTVTVRIPARGFSQFDVNAQNGPTTSVSAEITSDNPIVAERLMYFHYGPNHISGGTDIVGTTSPQSVYAFAEGFTGSSFSEFLTLLNPTNTDETVAVTYFTTNNVFEQQIVVRAFSRSTININNAVSPIEGGGVSMVAEAISGDDVIVAERSMYFTFTPPEQGGTAVLGFSTVPCIGATRRASSC